MQNDKSKFKSEFIKRVYAFVLSIIKLLDSFKKDSVSRVIESQLIRSSTSIIANIVEARSASSRKDYTNFFSYALKSANETKVWLSLLKDSRNIEVDKFIKEAEEISNILASSILTLKNRK